VSRACPHAKAAFRDAQSLIARWRRCSFTGKPEFHPSDAASRGGLVRLQKLPVRHTIFPPGHTVGPKTTAVANGECIRDHPGYPAGVLEMSDGGGGETVYGGPPTAFMSHSGVSLVPGTSVGAIEDFSRAALAPSAYGRTPLRGVTIGGGRLRTEKQHGRA
jgi:hypothetical protein